jgi:hypothetical protein
MYPDKPEFILSSCGSAQEYLVQNDRFLKALAHDEDFADYMNRKGIDPSGQAVTVRPNNVAAIAFMFRKDEAVWLYHGLCEDVPLQEPVRLKIREACSDTGHTFIEFFDDVGILEIVSL